MRWNPQNSTGIIQIGDILNLDCPGVQIRIAVHPKHLKVTQTILNVLVSLFLSLCFLDLLQVT